MCLHVTGCSPRLGGISQVGKATEVCYLQLKIPLPPPNEIVNQYSSARARFLVKRGPFKCLTSVLRQAHEETSAQLKVLSVFAPPSFFLWLSPTFLGLTTGNERKHLSYYHQKVFPFCPFSCSANDCTWFYLQLWRPGEYEGCHRVQAPGSSRQGHPNSQGLLTPLQRLGGKGSACIVFSLERS